MRPANTGGKRPPHDSKPKKPKLKPQPADMVFALDIGTRSIIGIAGTVDGERLKVTAIEKEEHAQRSMIDGQIEDIDEVAKVARVVKGRLEGKLGCRLKRVCVAAAGRALQTQKASYELELPQLQRLDEEIISRLEAGAICEAENAFNSGLDSENARRFYLVGHTVVQYYADNYPLSNLLEHQARRIRADVIATFLPSEVVDSLYTVMKKLELEVASLTLEPIAAINAVIPKKLRLLNLALVDIGAGTSDIAVCRDGGIAGYTMATVAGDEITESLMKKYLLDFNTAELVKTQLGTQKTVSVTDILGMEQTISQEDMLACIEDSASELCSEIAERIRQVNGGPPSAVFLAGGGSKLAGLREGVAKQLKMDLNRVVIGGNNFQAYAYSDEYNINDPEYATPLGIAVSAGLNLINESFQITLNGARAKLFRNNAMTVMDILMMNGYTYQDFMPRSGPKLTILLDGKQSVYYGSPGEPARLLLNGREAKLSSVVHAGDAIDFTPAAHGKPAQLRLGELLAAYPGREATVNGREVPADTLLKQGDVVVTREVRKEPALEAPEGVAETSRETREPEAPAEEDERVVFFVNNQPVVLSRKPDGAPYYLMDMIEMSGINLDNPTGRVILRVNGADAAFLQTLNNGDRLDIYYASGDAEK